MKQPAFRVQALDASQDRTTFCCGVPQLDHYFQQQVGQDMRRRYASCFVALDGGQQIAGFYTLASSSMLLSGLPTSIAKKLPRYPTVPTVRMGRLAVGRQFKGMGLGGALLADALARATRADIAAFAMVVDAKDETAASFYRHHGFTALPETPLSMFLPLAVAVGLR